MPQRLKYVQSYLLKWRIYRLILHTKDIIAVWIIQYSIILRTNAYTYSMYQTWPAGNKTASPSLAVFAKLSPCRFLQTFHYVLIFSAGCNWFGKLARVWKAERGELDNLKIFWTEKIHQVCTVTYCTYNIVVHF